MVVFNFLDYPEFNLQLVNAQLMKHVPKRKSDVADCQWLCSLHSEGLLNHSFIPKKDVRILRDLTRYENKLQEQKSSFKNRIHKILDICNIKLSNVLSDIFGKTGLRILRLLSNGVSCPKKLSENFLSVNSLRKKHSAALIALEGNVGDHDIFLLKSCLNQIDSIENEIKSVNYKINSLISENFDEAKSILKKISGIDDKCSNIILSELGDDMSAFPNVKHVTSWAGTSPRISKSGKCIRNVKNEGNPHLKSALRRICWSAIKCNFYNFRVIYYELKNRIGAKRALGAISNKLLKNIYYSLLPIASRST